MVDDEEVFREDALEESDQDGLREFIKTNQQNRNNGHSKEGHGAKDT